MSKREELARALFDTELPASALDWEGDALPRVKEMYRLQADALAGLGYHNGPKLPELVDALAPFAEFARASSFDRLPDTMPMTQGSALARRQVTAGDFKRALRAITGAQP